MNNKTAYWFSTGLSTVDFKCPGLIDIDKKPLEIEVVVTYRVVDIINYTMNLR